MFGFVRMRYSILIMFYEVADSVIVLKLACSN